MTCSRLQRWSECFAFSLSALDEYQEEFSYLHDVLCSIALSGNKMGVSLDWCCEVLQEARLCATSVDHSWKRIIVFQSGLTDNGFFDLENVVFGDSQHLFNQATDFYVAFMIQHIQAKMAQVEFNLAFQYVRQHFHSDCAEFCNKDPCLKQSFETTLKLLNQLDAFSQTISLKGVKEYFRGYFYLYSSMKQVHAVERQGLLIQLSLAFFQLAKDVMRTSDPLYLDLIMMLTFLKKVPMTIQTIHSHFSKKTLMQNTMGASQFLFRAMLITMYWDNHFQPFPIGMLASNAREMEAKITHRGGYKLKLLAGCIRVGDGTLTHDVNKELADYPNIALSKERDLLLQKATSFWNREIRDLRVIGHQNTFAKQEVTNARAIIQSNKMAEQVYAFGHQIIEAWTLPY